MKFHRGFYIFFFSFVLLLCPCAFCMDKKEKDEGAERKKKVSTKNIVKVKWLKLKNFVNLQNTCRKVVKRKFHFIIALLILPSIYTFLFTFFTFLSFEFNDVEYYAQISISRNVCCNRFQFFFRRKKASIEFLFLFSSDSNDKLRQKYHTYVYTRF